MNRRKFIDNLTKGATGLVVLPLALTSCEDPMDDPMDNPDVLDNGGNDGGDNGGDNGTAVTIDLTDSQYSALTSSGGYIIKSGVIVINAGGTFIALSSVCTHQGCSVTYDSTAGNLPCPCHNSVFSTSGSVLEGPADAPLDLYGVTQEGDILTINV